jgi:hypothetical protein
MKGLLMARHAPSTSKSERDSSRALLARHIIFKLTGGNFERSSFASFLTPSRKEEENIFYIMIDFILGKSVFFLKPKQYSGCRFREHDKT